MPLFSGIKNATAPNQLFTSLEKKEWRRAVEITKRSPGLAEQAVMTKRFYGKPNTIAVNALQLACKLQAPREVVEAIIAACPALVTATDVLYRRNALHVATIFGAPSQSIQALLEKHPKGADAVDKDGRLPLHFACGCLITNETDKRNIIRLLLKANPDAAKMPEFNDDFTPLHVACQSAGSHDIIRLLVLAAPESVFAKSRLGRTAIECAKVAMERDASMMDEERIAFLERFSLESHSQSFQLSGSSSPQSGPGFEKSCSMSERTEETESMSCDLSVTDSY